MNNGLLGQVFVLIYTNSIYLTLAASKDVITLTFLTFKIFLFSEIAPGSINPSVLE